MIRLYTAANLPEAYLVRSLLERAGIEAHVFNENTQGGLPFIHTDPEVWLVDERDWERGRRIVESYKEAGARAADRTCPRCGERNPETFELCWNCSATL